MNREAKIVERIVCAAFGSAISVRAPGVEDVLEDDTPIPARGDYYKPSVMTVIDRVMLQNGFGGRRAGKRHYADDYWVKGGKSWRIKDIIDDALILEEHASESIW